MLKLFTNKKASRRACRLLEGLPTRFSGRDFDRGFEVSGRS